MVGRQFEPVGIAVGTNKPKLSHRMFQRPDPGHALGRVNAGEGREAGGMRGDGLGHHLIGQTPAGAGAFRATAMGHEKGALDPRGVHLRQHGIQGQARICV